MTQPQLMRQIADAMERNPEGWFREFEYFNYQDDEWETLKSEHDLPHPLLYGVVRPKPRTYTLHVEEMPEPLREEPRSGKRVYLVSLLTGNVVSADWDGSRRMGQELDCGLVYPDEPTAREALEKLTKAMGGGND